MDYLQEYENIVDYDMPQASFDDIHDKEENEYEKIIIFDNPAYNKTTARQFFEEFYFPLQDLYFKYFDIFHLPSSKKTPKKDKKFYYKVLFAPVGFTDNFNKFLINYSLHNYKFLLLYLIADMIGFRRDPFNEYIELGSMKAQRERIEQLEGLSDLSEYLNTNKKGDKLPHIKVRFSYSNKHLTLSSPDFVESYVSMERLLNFKNLYSMYYRPNLKSVGIYKTYYSQTITFTLDQFLREQSLIYNQATIKQKSYKKALECIYEIFMFAGYSFIDAFLNQTTDKKQVIVILKKWLD